MVLLVVIPLLVAARVDAQTTTPAQPQLVLQSGHSGRVSRLAFSLDRRFFASSSTDNTIKIWDLSEGLEFRTLAGHSDGVGAVAFSPDGFLLASGDAHNVVKLWDVRQGREIFSAPLGGHEVGVVEVAFSSDGKRLISLSSNRAVNIWDVTSQQPLNSFNAGGVSGPTNFTRLTPDGRWVMSGVYDDTQSARRTAVGLWDVNTGQRVSYAVLHADSDIYEPTPSPDGRWMVSSDEHQSIQLWNMATGVRIYSTPPQPQTIYNKSFSFAFSPDLKILAVGDYDAQTVRLLEASTGRDIKTFEKAYPRELAFNADGSRLAGARGSNIAVIDPSSGQVLQTLRGFTRFQSSMAMSSDGHLLAFGSEDRSVVLWDLRLGAQVRTFGNITHSDIDAGATAVAFSPDGSWLASSCEESNENTVAIWNASTGRRVATLHGFRNGVTSISFSPDGHLIAAGDFNGNMKIFEAGTWKDVGGLSAGVLWPPSSVAFSPDSHWLAVTERDSIDIWDVTKRDWDFRIPSGWDLSLAFSPDSKRLASFDLNQHSVTVWNLATRDAAWSGNLPEHLHTDCLAFSGDGRLLAAASEDHTIHLWDVARGTELPNLIGHAAAVRAVAFTPESRWLISASEDGSVRVWSFSAGTAVARLSTINGSDDWAVVTPDGLFDGSREGTHKLIAWRIQDHILAASQYYNTYSTPGLLAQILTATGTAPQPAVPFATLKLPPTVHISPPLGGKVVHQAHVTVKVEVRDEGGGISVVRLYRNGTLFASRQPPPGPQAQYSFDVTLLPGQDNFLKAIALGKDSVESNPEELVISFEAPPPPKPALYVLVVGINDYADNSLHLDFAKPDGDALARFFRSHGNLFSSVNVIPVFNADATRAGITQALNQLVEKTQLEDVALIYFAGHGFLSGQQFYFLPQDFKKEADLDAAVQKYGIPASIFGDALLRLKANKQILILDACQSESALPALAKAAFRTRGAETPEDRALRMLAHANGVYLIAATTALRPAYEVPELGHGLLTYALLSGLGETSEPQAANSSGTVTVISLINYVARTVPELTEKYHMGEAQTPVMVDAGTDIPLLVATPAAGSRP